jgi:AcrR family transcriptional regulator
MGKGRQTRDAVIDHALRLTSTVGLEGLSLGSLAKDVGMSKSGLFAHFDSKEQLQLDVLRWAGERFIAQVVSPALQQPRGEPRVRALIENWLAWDCSPELPGGCVFMSFAHELDDRPGPLRDALVRTLRDWIETLQTAVRIAVREGHFRADLDVASFVYEGYGNVLAYNHYKRLLGDARAEVHVRAAFDALIERSRAGGEN